MDLNKFIKLKRVCFSKRHFKEVESNISLFIYLYNGMVIVAKMTMNVVLKKTCRRI